MTCKELLKQLKVGETIKHASAVVNRQFQDCEKNNYNKPGFDSAR